MTENNDPRKYPGDITGPGDSHAKGEFIIDARNALFLNSVNVVKIDTVNDYTLIGMLLEGRVNQTKDKAKFLVLLNEDAMAAIITELVAITGRMGKANAEQFLNDMVERIKNLKESGDLE